MSTFIKLTNGTTVNSAIIGSVEASKYVSAAQYSRAFASTSDENAMIDLKGKPAIKLTNVHGNTTDLVFGSEEERDAELARIEGLLVPGKETRMVMLDGYMINPRYLSAVFVDKFTGAPRLNIKIAGHPSLTRHLHRGEELTIMNDIRAVLGEGLFDRVASTEV